MPQITPQIRLMRAVLRDLVVADDTKTSITKLEKKNTHQPVGTMLMAARFISTLEKPDSARDLAAPMTVTALIHNDSNLRGHFMSASEAILVALSDQVGVDLMTDLSVIALELSDRRDRTYRNERFQHDLDDALVRGKSVLTIVGAPTELSDAARALLTRSYDLPPIDGRMIAEVMRALGRAPSRKLAACLTERDAAIGSLPAAIVIAALRLADPGRTVRVILDAIDRLNAPARHGMSLEDLHLTKEIAAHFRGIVADIEQWREGKLAWEDVSCSTLLYGPPGNGKTSLALALAGSAGLHYVSGSYAEAQAAGSLSHYLGAMEKRAAEAIGNAPSLFFVDELDSLPDRARNHAHNDAYMTSVVNHALELFTRLHRTPGVVLLAASNHVSNIDPALIRAGRLDTHVYVGPPDRAGIEAILRKRLSSSGGTLDLRAASRRLVGMSGADVATTATKAIAIARRAGRLLTNDDLEKAINRPVSAGFEEQIRRIAIHEAGHAVVRAAVGLRLPESAVLSTETSHVSSPAPSTLRLLEAEQVTATMLGGRAAELLVMGDASSGAETDIAQATRLALFSETRICVGTLMPIYLPYPPDQPETWPPELQTVVRKRMADAQKLALRAVQVNIDVVRAVADALVRERELDAEQLEELLRPVSYVPPASATAPTPLVAPHLGTPDAGPDAST
ncbi:AAA family ATPase [Donghicola sp. XS_ASV15]|uniref:AAA family ATPase n=1 Tax=Donghicola sp. XS_ASV15 TaxID=3241295 RepID=UPI00351102D9